VTCGLLPGLGISEELLVILSDVIIVDHVARSYQDLGALSTLSYGSTESVLVCLEMPYT